MAVAFADIFMARIENVTFSSISPYSRHFIFSLLPTFPGHFSLLPILLFSVQMLTYKGRKGGYGSPLTPTRVAM